MRLREWWQDVREAIAELGGDHLRGIVVEVGAVLALVAVSGLLALVIAGGRL